MLFRSLGAKVTHKHVSNFERDKTIAPLEIVLAYARAANVQMEQIVDDQMDLTP